MELKEVDELGEQSPEMSLAVKLAFNRICTLIYSLKNDIGEEAASNQLLRICNDADRVLKLNRTRSAMKENRIPHLNELDSTTTTVRTNKGAHNFVSQNSEPIVKHHQQNNGTLSFFSSKNDELCTSFSSSFRPMVRTTTDTDNCVSLGTIVEESRFEIDESDVESSLEEQDNNEENPYFILKSWSISLKDNELLLTGVKMNEKGETLVKNFVSQKILSRKQKDTVKTSDGEFVLQGKLVDKNKVIPNEVKNQYFDNEEFPRNWRMALKLWIELEEKKKKEEKLKKKIIPQKKATAEGGRKRSISPKKKVKDASIRKRSISPKKKTNDAKARKRSTSPKKKVQNVQSKKEAKVSPDKQKSQPPSTSKQEPSSRNKKTNDPSKCSSRKNKKTAHSENLDNLELEKNEAKKNLENGKGEDEQGPFSEILGDESLMIFPSSSLTPNGLLGSIKKNVIKGRYTPPTSMFDNVYGTKSDNNSSINTSFEDIGVKNNHVIKRMCKGNKKPKARQNNKSPKNRHVMEEDEAINEILRAAKSKTNTTPSIIKQVFSAERVEDSVNFSDLSDIEVA